MKILIGMSGGVDSAYAAKKLIDAGHTVEGAILIMHPYTEIQAAEDVCRSLDIRLRLVDCREAFSRVVVTDFINEYKSARTPNPCVICNSEIKFRYLYEEAVKNGFDAIATGHYGRVVRIDENGNITENTKSAPLGGEGRYALMRGKDIRKDQTYMLWRLPAEILSRLILPLGEETKEEVKVSAREAEISAADREESQEICFIPDNDYAAFIEERTGPSEKGNFIDEEGRVLGTHNGIIRYTMGQRRGLGISAASRIFVTDINVSENTITLSPTDKTYDTVFVRNISFSGMKPPAAGDTRTLTVKLRYGAKPAECTVEFLDEDSAIVKLHTPQRAVTPGQSAVFYDGDLLVCGGFIDSQRWKSDKV